MAAAAPYGPTARHPPALLCIGTAPALAPDGCEGGLSLRSVAGAAARFCRASPSAPVRPRSIFGGRLVRGCGGRLRAAGGGGHGGFVGFARRRFFRSAPGALWFRRRFLRLARPGPGFVARPPGGAVAVLRPAPCFVRSRFCAASGGSLGLRWRSCGVPRRRPACPRPPALLYRGGLSIVGARASSVLAWGPGVACLWPCLSGASAPLGFAPAPCARSGAASRPLARTGGGRRRAA